MSHLAASVTSRRIYRPLGSLFPPELLASEGVAVMTWDVTSPAGGGGGRVVLGGGGGGGGRHSESGKQESAGVWRACVAQWQLRVEV